MKTIEINKRKKTLANAISKFDELVEKINISEPLPELLKQIK
jgi:hypothetical protein